MGENLKIKKTGQSQYGYYLLVDDGTEKGYFKGTTDKVSAFLSGHIPCTIEVQETDEKGNITRVKFVGANLDKPEPTPSNAVPQPDKQREIRAEFCIREALRAIELHNQHALDTDSEIMKPTKKNIYESAKIIDEIINELVNGS